MSTLSIRQTSGVIAHTDIEARDDSIDYTTCLFEQPWWLDATAPGSWAAATVQRGGRVVARLPYATRKWHGLKFRGNPAFTPTLGPWLAAQEGKYVTRLGEEESLLTELIEQVPSCDVFRQTLAPGTNLLPFHWKGYTRTSSVTYRLEDLTDPERLWNNFSQLRRTNIRKARGALAVRADPDLAAFCQVANMTFARQDLKSPLDWQLLSRIDEACRKRNARRIFFADDGRGRTHAAMYLVWDSRAAYYLMGGADPELRNSGAQGLLMWEAIRFASTVTKVFDFEGSSVQGIERFIRSFGARQIVMPRVYRMSRRMSCLTGLKMVAEGLTGRTIQWFV